MKNPVKRMQHRYYRIAVRMMLALLLGSGVSHSPRSAEAQISGLQQGSGYPSSAYYGAMQTMYRGDLRDGAKLFRSAASSGYITGAGRWADSICYHTMIGECLYQSGDLPGAMEQYEAALTLYITHPTWLKTADFPADFRVANNAVDRARINWGASTRTTLIASVPDEVPILFGSDASNLNSLQKGGVITTPQYRRFNAHEISRCTALAISRRGEILGPLAIHDPICRQASDAAEGGNGNRHPYAATWGLALKGFGLSAMREEDKAIEALKASIQVARKYDHPLTSLILLELSKISYRNGKYEDAGTYAMEASYSAAVFDHHDVLVESFQLATACHLITGQKGIFPPLDPASDWARSKGSNQFQAVLPILAAQCMTESGQPADAAKLLASARKPMSRTDLMNSVIGTDFLYRSAQTAFQQHDMNDGLKALESALKSQIISSKWLYQIALTDQLYLAGKITPHTTGELFKILLREPQQEDWRNNPVETLAYVSLPQLKERQHWFEIAVARKEHERALEISDDIRRHRFYSTLPIGGRMLAMQSMLEAPEDTLTPEVLKMRQAFMLKHPMYVLLSSESNKTLEKLRAIPLSPDEKSQDLQDQKKLLEELEKVTALQEAYLADVSLRREPSVFGFPAQLKFDEARAQLAEGQTILSFLSTDRGVYAFIMTKDNYAFQQLTDARQVKKEITALLRNIGHLDPNNQLKPEQFDDDSWRQPAAALMKLLMPKATADFWRSQNELVIIPDGLLWYLPFELLQVTDGDRQYNLMDSVKIRYAPTVATALGGNQPLKVNATRAFVTGKLYLRDDLKISTEAFEELRPKLDGAVKVPFKLPGTSKLISALIDDLIVWDDIDESTKGVTYDWSPLQIDRGKPGSTLDSWMSLPHQGPAHIFLPGFHTNAATGIKGSANGDEVFLTVCGLMAGGAKTVFISRWRVGGESAYQLTERLVRNMTKMSAADAWRDSVEDFLSEEELPIETEPRIKNSQTISDVKSAHPFFWAGYILVDTGSDPGK